MTQKMTVAEWKARGQKPKAGGQANSPAAGPTVPRPPRKKSSPTAALTRAALALLRLYGFSVWRQNNAAVYDASFGGYRAGSSTPGISDIIGWENTTGRFVAVEVKYGPDELSDEQTEFLATVCRAGGFACTCRSVGQMEQELKQYLFSGKH